jgi:hypothetical protein
LSLHRTDIINSSFALEFARANAETNSCYSRRLEEEVFEKVKSNHLLLCEKLFRYRMNPFHLLDPNLPGRMARGVCALAVMSKAPQAGRVKTRLVPPLTPEQAAELNRCFLRDTAASISIAYNSRSVGEAHTSHKEAATAARGIAVYTPVGAESAYDGILPADFSLLPQRGDKFGEVRF